MYLLNVDFELKLINMIIICVFNDAYKTFIPEFCTKGLQIILFRFMSCIFTVVA